jgi:hypothetical protein
MHPDGTFLPCFSYSLACEQRIFQFFSHSFFSHSFCRPGCSGTILQ